MSGPTSSGSVAGHGKGSPAPWDRDPTVSAPLGLRVRARPDVRVIASTAPGPLSTVGPAPRDLRPTGVAPGRSLPTRPANRHEAFGLDGDAWCGLPCCSPSAF